MCDVLSGGTPSTKRAEYWDGGIPWASVKDFNSGFRWFSATEKNISREGLDNCSSVLLEPGELILSARGTVGVVAQAGIRTAFNQSNYGLRAKAQVGENDFLYYALIDAKQRLLGDAHGGMFDTVTRATLERLLVPCPPLAEQKRIAQILGLFDKKIAVNLNLAATLEELAAAIFKSWFIDFEPVKAKMAGEVPVGMDAETAALFPDSMEESELGNIPRAWRVKRLGDLALTLLGGTPSRKQESFWGGNVPWINSGKMNDFRVTSPSEYITELGLEKSATKLLPKGTCAIAITGATLGQFTRLEIDSCANQSVVGVLESEAISNEFIYLLFAHQIDRLVSAQTGGAQQHINKNDVNDFRLVCPPEDVMAEFTRIVRPIFDAIGLRVFESESLRALRDVLLPRLISGELEIPDEMLAA